ncbi:MAG: hypothetical protein FMNOHCHN_03643 [Ignavibacteriaceae bacterium]|nr:hypothetical protein [Ignavibacteriaceae bacterium]
MINFFKNLFKKKKPKLYLIKALFMYRGWINRQVYASDFKHACKLAFGLFSLFESDYIVQKIHIEEI